MYTGVLFPVRSDCSGFDSSTPEGMRGVLGAELKFMGHDRKLSLLSPAPPPQPHHERACTQANICLELGDFSFHFCNNSRGTY